MSDSLCLSSQRLFEYEFLWRVQWFEFTRVLYKLRRIFHEYNICASFNVKRVRSDRLALFFAQFSFVSVVIVVHIRFIVLANYATIL